ncbi:Leucine-rich repeat [Arabidopsis suecica]|uniref:Leucine-rich repeat n=1 Tax=Arabidopsis suecica TaxID=45249 RepID=A0A8T2B6A7_ARASU|nr:Leucine-rich repeat [Arabidopsis suecica]
MHMPMIPCTCKCLSPFLASLRFYIIQRLITQHHSLQYQTFILKMRKLLASPFSSLLAVCFISVISVVRCCSPKDQTALNAFKSSLSEPNLGIFNTWSENTDCCKEWYGISCDPDSGRVTDILLRGESEDAIFQKAGRSGYMSGSIDPAVCDLTALTSLVLADWKGITGEIPPCVTSLASLRILDLAGNKITGEIPAEIGKLSKLAVLNLADNQMSGEIPSSLTSLVELKHLELTENGITGVIPADFGSLKMLSRVLLGRNELTGSIPESISGMERLVDLDLSRNHIEGPIPEWMGNMKVLSLLNLDCNSLTGSIPGSLLSNSGLDVANLSRNALEGSIPDVFGSKTYLVSLDLSHNSLSGRIPDSLSSAKFVGHLDISHNKLCGRIPTGSPFDHLEATSFSDNQCLCGGPLMTLC